MHYYLDAWKHYTDFDGRSTRIAYWAFCWVDLVIVVMLAVLRGSIDAGAGVLSTLYSLAIVIPSWAYAVRRLHDTGRSGWHLLWSLLPLIGWIVLLVFLLEKGRPGTNAYGPNPLETL